MAKILNPREFYEFKEIITSEFDVTDGNIVSWLKNILLEEFNILVDLDHTKIITDEWATAGDDFISVICLKSRSMFLYFNQWIETEQVPKFSLIRRSMYFEKGFVIQWKNTRELDNVEYCHQKDK